MISNINVNSLTPTSTVKPQQVNATQAFSVPSKGEAALPDELKRSKGSPIQDSFSQEIPLEHPIRDQDKATLVPQPTGKNQVFGPALTHTGLGQTGLSQLISQIQQNTFQGNALFLAQNQLTDDQTLPLLKALKYDQSIKHLILSRNQLTTFAMAGLADLLKVNHDIGWVILSNNKLGDNGVTTLADALKSNTGVKHLILDHNFVGNTGAIALAEAIQHHSGIQSLVLSSNNIQDDGAKAFITVIKNHPSLKKLDLTNNKLSPEVKAQLLEVAKQRKGFILNL